MNDWRASPEYPPAEAAALQSFIRCCCEPWLLLPDVPTASGPLLRQSDMNDLRASLLSERWPASVLQAAIRLCCEVCAATPPVTKITLPASSATAIDLMALSCPVVRVSATAP